MNYTICIPVGNVECRSSRKCCIYTSYTIHPSIYSLLHCIYNQCAFTYPSVSVSQKGGEKFRQMAVDVAVCGGMAQPSQLRILGLSARGGYVTCFHSHTPMRLECPLGPPITISSVASIDPFLAEDVGLSIDSTHIT
jgi:hypothetical protein